MENKKYLAMLMAWDILSWYKQKENRISKIDMECGSITLDETLDVIAELGSEFEKVKTEPLKENHNGK
jgi:hypothetical protein